MEMGTIGRSVVIKGEVRADADLTIEGRVDGKVHLGRHALTIGPRATIEASIQARMVTVMGTVTGDIAASETIELRETARVEGTLVSRSVAMAPGASFRGEIDMRRDDVEEGVEPREGPAQTHLREVAPPPHGMASTR